MSSCERGKQALVKTPWTRIKIKAKIKYPARPLHGHASFSGFQHPPKNTPRCTTLAAVINSALDRKFFKVLNLPDKKKIFGEDFHKRKIFVLLCGTDPA